MEQKSIFRRTCVKCLLSIEALDYVPNKEDAADVWPNLERLLTEDAFLPGLAVSGGVDLNMKLFFKGFTMQDLMNSKYLLSEEGIDMM
eukprot:scaffold921_cov126-Cylindrotheca_fusiformis.AAC.9